MRRRGKGHKARPWRRLAKSLNDRGGSMLKAKVSISRNSKDIISIRFTDCASGITFAEAEMSLNNFASAITGLSRQDANLKINDLNFVGKKYVTEPRRISCPLKTYNRETLEKWLEENAQEEGWLVKTYLGSQDSISYIGDTTYLNYRVVKYVDMEADDENA